MDDMSKLHYFPCMVRDLLSSSTVELMSGDGFKAYWILLCRSWLENERATLPNNQAKLVALARVDATKWDSIKDEVLACFRENENGRLYNETLLTLSDIQYKKSKAGSKGGSKTQANRVAKVVASESESESSSEAEVKKKKRTAPKGAESFTSKHGLKIWGRSLKAFKVFWEAFDLKDGRADAIDPWVKLVGNGDDIAVELASAIIAAAKAEACDRDPVRKSPKMAQGWLTSRRFDDLQPKEAPKPKPVGKQLTDEELDGAEEARSEAMKVFEK